MKHIPDPKPSGLGARACEAMHGHACRQDDCIDSLLQASAREENTHGQYRKMDSFHDLFPGDQHPSVAELPCTGFDLGRSNPMPAAMQTIDRDVDS